MDQQANRITELITRSLKENLSDSENAELEAWKGIRPENKQIAEEFSTEEKLRSGIKEMYRLEEVIWDRIEEAIEVKPVPATSGTSSITWKRLAIAASVLLVIGLGSYFAFFNGGGKKALIVKNIPSDIKAPTSNKAVITLADGRTISLDSLTTISENGVTVVKTAEGKIIYSGNSSEVAYNTLFNPRGSKVIDMQLSDGSHVWLNAGSSITYPVAFVGNERKVSMTGEAYFEVSTIYDVRGTIKTPFIVEKGDMQVQVLGTHFNVNAYDDEEEIKVTLLEGAVIVNRKSSFVNLKPGEQARAISNGQLVMSKNVDVEEIMAWKNGRFSFTGTSLETILKEISRWYDAEIIYQNNVKGNFVADVPRTVEVSKLLHALELTGRVHFKIEGKKITVMQ